MYKLTIDKPKDDTAEPHLILEGPEGEQRFQLGRPQVLQLLGEMNVFSTGKATVIEDFPAPDANPGGEAPSGTLTSWPIHQTTTPDAIRQARLTPVEAVIEAIANGARVANLVRPTIGTLESPEEDGPRLAIPEHVLSAIRERVTASLVS